MQTIRVATWNAEGMFSDGAMTKRASPHDALSTLKNLDADIVTIPEFGVNGRVDGGVLIAIRSLGYQIIEVPYDDPTMPNYVPENYEMALLTRLPLRSHTLHRFANSGRRFVEAHIELPGNKNLLRVIGLHLDDKAEKLRLEQVDQVIELANKAHVGQMIVLGDFNAMPSRSNVAKILRTKTAGALGSVLPHAFMRSMSKRVNEMAIGTTIARLLAATTLRDLDTKHRLTVSAKNSGAKWLPSIKIAKIDWILATSLVKVLEYKIFSDVGSDHRPVRATIQL